MNRPIFSTLTLLCIAISPLSPGATKEPFQPRDEPGHIELREMQKGESHELARLTADLHIIIGDLDIAPDGTMALTGRNIGKSPATYGNLLGLMKKWAKEHPAPEPCASPSFTPL